MPLHSRPNPFRKLEQLWSPLTATRQDRFWRRVFLFALIFQALAAIPISIPRLPVPFRLFLAAVVLTLMLAAMVMFLRHYFRARRAIINARFLLCPGCRYTLEGLEHATACPECGRAYTFDSLVRTWKEAYHIR